MANQKHENLIKKLKSNLCGVFLCKNVNYEQISYLQENVDECEKAKRCDNFDQILTPKLQTRSRSRLPIYYKTPSMAIIQDKQREEAETFGIEGSQLQITLNKNQLHSTKLNENVNTPKLPLIPMSPNCMNTNKATSTMIYEIFSKTQNELNTESPAGISNINAPQFYRSTSFSSGTTSSSTTPSSLTSSSIHENLFKIGSIYACHVPYKSQQDGDLTIKFAERLQIIKDDGDEFILVKSLSNHNFGYIPRVYILPVDKFLASLA